MARPASPKKPADVVPLRAPRKCPVCGKPAVRALYPFDSKRCADIDLGRWLKEDYRVPTDETPGPETEGREED